MYTMGARTYVTLDIVGSCVRMRFNEATGSERYTDIMRIPEGHGQVTWILSGPVCPTGAVVTCGFFNATDRDASACCLDLDNIFATDVMPAVVDGVTHIGTLVKLGPNEDGPTALITGSTAGGISAQGTPPNVAALISKTTNVGGREGRGRFFLPGLPENDVDESGLITVGHLGVLQPAMDSLLSDATTQDVPLELLHNSTRNPSGLTGLSVDGRVATQRRRLRR